MDFVLRISVLLSFMIELVGARVYCSNDGYYSYYCDDGYYCCENTKCCNQSLSAGAIVGIIIAIIVFVSIVFGIVYYIKKKQRPGTIIQPGAGNPSVAVVHQNIQPAYQQPQHGQAYPPPTY